MRMRRTATVTLTIVAGAGLGLAFCRHEPDGAVVVDSESACTDRLGSNGAGSCADLFQSAQQAHAASAPRFPSPAACEAATGTTCLPLPAATAPAAGPEVASAAAQAYIPAMAGVMLGRALADGTRRALPVYAGTAALACAPAASGASSAPCPPNSSGPGHVGGGSGGGGSGAGGSGAGTGSGTGGGTRRYWFTGNDYAGMSEAGSRRVAPTGGIEGRLSPRGGSAVGAGGRSGTSASRAGGLGEAAAAHGGGGS